jgi:hypothetical protein
MAGPKRGRARRVQLVAEAVAVCCPACGEPQPNYMGSEMWTAEDFVHAEATRECAACDTPLIVAADSKAQFHTDQDRKRAAWRRHLREARGEAR